MRLTWLADACRQADLCVVEENGWKTRGSPFPDTPVVVVAHHTASNRRSGPMPSLNLLIDGRSDLRGPLSQVGLARDGTVHIIASGKANHAGSGNWRHVSRSEKTVGVEAENDGVGEPWPQAQLDAYDRLCAVLLEGLGQPAGMLCGHREWALPRGRKIDPTGIDMAAMRRRVARLLEGDDMELSQKDVERIAEAVLDAPVRKNARPGTPATLRQIVAWTWAHTLPAHKQKERER